MKIGPDIWGPHGWKFIHMIALAYPDSPSDEKKKHYKDFFTAIQHILPCSICANNYTKNITTELPITDEVLKNKENFLKWSIDLHNLVNKETGKQPLSYDDALDLIYNNYETKSKLIMMPNKNITQTMKNTNEPENSNGFFSFSLLLIIFVILIIIAIVYKKH